MLIMPQIIPLDPSRKEEARQVIYLVAHQQFHSEMTLQDTITMYREEWPLHDLDDPQLSYFDNGGTFLVIIEDGRIIGTGGLRRLEEGVGEIKRLWLLFEYHGQGLGYQIMKRLFAVAREKGYQKVRLCTSPKYQQRAFDFYRKLGFYEIPRYNDDPDDVSLEYLLEQ